METKYELIAKIRENVALYWKTIKYQKEGQEKSLTQLVLRAKYKDELGDLVAREVNLSTKENYKNLYAIKMNALN